MIGKWLAKLYDRFNDTPDIDVDGEIKEAAISFDKYKRTSKEFQNTKEANHFAKYLVYSREEKVNERRS